MTLSSGDPDVARLAYQAATSRVAGQRSTVDELRSRASGLLGASAIATSFLAGFALDNREDDLTFFALVGFVAPVITVILLLLVLRPTDKWRFGHDPERLLSYYYEGQFSGSEGRPLPLEAMHVFATQDMSKWIAENKKKLNRYFHLFQMAVIAVGLTVLAWLADLYVITFDPDVSWFFI